ncbi:hypothetical protein GGI21_005178, partial [Coemansia aciculifera]
MEITSPDNEENAWSTVLTTMPSSSAGTAAAAAAHTRGLTSALSGRRQRLDSIAQEQYHSSSPTSTAPEAGSSHSRMYEGQAQRHAQVKFVSREHSPALGKQGRGAGNTDKRRADYVIAIDGNNGDDDDVDDDDAPPPDSLLVEVPEQSAHSPRRQDTNPAGFVRRAARA